MNNTSGRTSDEKDEARHFYAVGTVLVRAIADEISEMALTGDGISRWELKRLHDQLSHVYEILGSHTVFGMRDEPVTDGSPKALRAYWDTYSDGAPVTIVVGPRVAGAGQRRRCVRLRYPVASQDHKYR
jgi:hypothetical protein